MWVKKEEKKRVFQGSFKGIPKKSLGCFNEVSRVFQESFKWGTRVFKRSSMGVLGKF